MLQNNHKVTLGCILLFTNPTVFVIIVPGIKLFQAIAPL